MFNTAQFDGRRLLGWCVMLAAIVLLGLAAQRALFLMRAQRTTGTVAHLSSKNDLCGIGRASHDCTRFYAQLNFDDTLGIAPATVAAGVRIPRDREQGFHGIVNTDSTAT